MLIGAVRGVAWFTFRGGARYRAAMTARTWLARARAFLPVRVIVHLYDDDGQVMAGGVALFLLLGLLPSMTAVVSIYALGADPSTIPSQLAGLEQVVPRAVHDLVVDQLQRAARRSDSELGAAVAGSLAIALWAARSSASAMLAAINHVDGGPRRWTGWRWVVVTIAVAVGAIVVALIVLAMVVAMPAVSHVLRPEHRAWVEDLRWPVTIGVVIGGLALLYWLATPHATAVRHVLPGAFVATSLMLAASMGLSWYVTQASYGSVYGAFGSVLVVILWFYVCSMAVLVGAITNFEIRASVPGDDAGASTGW